MLTSSRITKAARKRGVNATKKVERIRINALRKHKVQGQSLAEIEKRNADRPLTEKQRLFVRFWAQGETPRTASTLAGFKSPTNYWQLTKDPAIIAIYWEEKRLYEEASQMTRKRVMDMLQESYDCAKMVNEPASMVAAAREIGKMCGYYEPEKHLHVHTTAQAMERLASLPDEELLKLIESPDVMEGEATEVPPS